MSELLSPKSSESATRPINMLKRAGAAAVQGFWRYRIGEHLRYTRNIKNERTRFGVDQVAEVAKNEIGIRIDLFEDAEFANNGVSTHFFIQTVGDAAQSTLKSYSGEVVISEDGFYGYSAKKLTFDSITPPTEDRLSDHEVASYLKTAQDVLYHHPQRVV